MAIWLIAGEVSTTVIIGMAFWLSLFAKTRSRPIYLLVGLLLWLAASGMCGVLAYFSFAIRSRGSTVAYFPQATLLCGIIGLGGLWLLIRGAIRREGQLRAAKWRSVWLLVAWLVAGMVQTCTLNFLDGRAKGFAADTRTRATEDYAELTEPMPADADNAKELYLDAFARMTAVTKEFDRELKTKRPPSTGPTINDSFSTSSDLLEKENADRPETGELLDRLAPAMKLLERASIQHFCRFRIVPSLPDISDFTSAKDDHLNHFRTACRALQAHAVRACHRGEIDDALSDVRTTTRLTNHVDQTQPALVQGLVRNGMTSIACDTLVAVLPYVRPATAFPDGMLPDESTVTTAFTRNVRGEESLILGTLLNWGDGKIGLDDNRDKSPKVAQLYRIFWLRPDVEITGTYMARERGLIGTPAASQARRNVDGSLLLQILNPSLSRARNSHLETLCAVRQANVALAITRYRLRRGTSPGQLQDLVPGDLSAIPLDPFDGKPMKYRLEAGDTILYSVGKDQKDDGGQIDDGKDRGFRLRWLADVLPKRQVDGK